MEESSGGAGGWRVYEWQSGRIQVSISQSDLSVCSAASVLSDPLSTFILIMLGVSNVVHRIRFQTDRIDSQLKKIIHLLKTNKSS